MIYGIEVSAAFLAASAAGYALYQKITKPSLKYDVWIIVCHESCIDEFRSVNPRITLRYMLGKIDSTSLEDSVLDNLRKIRCEIMGQPYPTLAEAKIAYNSALWTMRSITKNVYGPCWVHFLLEPSQLELVELSSLKPVDTPLPSIL